MDKNKVLKKLEILSQNLLIDLNEKEKEDLTIKIQSLEYDFDKLSMIDTSGASPMNYVSSETLFELRSDEEIENEESVDLFNNSSNKDSEMNFIIEGDENFE